jgi:hypothetical protein
MPLTVTPTQTDQIMASLMRAFDGQEKPKVGIFPLEWDEEECEHWYPCKITVVTGKTAPSGLFSSLRTPKSNGFIVVCAAPIKDGSVRKIEQVTVSAMISGKNGQELLVPKSEDLTAKLITAIQAEIDRVATLAVDFDATPIVPKRGQFGARITLNSSQAAKIIDEIGRRIDDPDATQITVGRVERDLEEYRDFRHCTALVTMDSTALLGFLVSWNVVINEGVADRDASKDSGFSIRTVVDGKVGCKLYLPDSRPLEEIIYPVMQPHVDNVDAPIVAKILGRKP